MGCTISGSSGDESVHLDPWHKMHLGWVEPRFVSVENNLDTEQCILLEPPQFDGNQLRSNQQPLFVYDDSFGVENYFMIEFRNRWFEEPGMYSYERDVPGAGIALWSVHTNEHQWPEVIPSITTPGGIDMSIWTYGPNTTSRGEYLWPANSSVVPHYQDGRRANFRMTVKSFPYTMEYAVVCLERLE
jgi:hypothetical protein